MPYLNLSGNKINYNVAGNGNPLVLLHNGFYSTVTWDGIRKKLSDKFMIIDYDRFGYGKSDKFKSAVSGDIIEHGVNELFELLKALNIEKINICGHCLGGAIAIKFAIKYPEKINKLIIMSTGFYSDHKMQLKADYTFQYFDKINKKLKENIIKMHGKDYSVKLWDILRNHKESYIMNKEYNILNDLKNVKCPTLIINGDRDFFFEIEHALAAFRKIKQSELSILPDTGHDPHLESEKEFLLQLEKFILK